MLYADTPTQGAACNRSGLAQDPSLWVPRTIVGAPSALGPRGDQARGACAIGGEEDNRRGLKNAAPCAPAAGRGGFERDLGVHRGRHVERADAFADRLDAKLGGGGEGIQRTESVGKSPLRWSDGLGATY